MPQDLLVRSIPVPPGVPNHHPAPGGAEHAPASPPPHLGLPLDRRATAGDAGVRTRGRRDYRQRRTS